MHAFDAAIALAPTADENRFLGTTSPAYTNMVGPYGGITAAVLLNAALVHPARLGDPIAMTINYARAVADGAFEIHARPVRTNRSTQHWSIELVQADGVAAIASAVFAKRRETFCDTEAAPPHPVAPFAELPRRPHVSPPLPWVRQYDIRFASGGPQVLQSGTESGHASGSDNADAETVLWVRDDPPRPLDFASLQAISDCFFPRLFVRRRRRVPIGTVTMTTYFHADAAQLATQGDRPLLGHARGQAYRNGYFDQSGWLWSDSNELLVSTHQMVYFRE